MGSWFERRSVRVKIVLLVLTMLVPAAAMLAWMPALHLRQARQPAYAKVQILAALVPGRHVRVTQFRGVAVRRSPWLHMH